MEAAPGVDAGAPPLRDGAVVLVGYMGAGKTTLAGRLAEARGLRHRDTDTLLAERAGRTIPQLFADEGEAGFRDREERLVLEVLAGAGPGDVVSLGGGAVLRPAVQEALDRHVVVLAEVDADTAWSRCGGVDRPLATDPASFAARLADRTPTYEALADAFVPATADADVLVRAAGLLDALREAPGGARGVWARAGATEHPVLVGRGVLRTPRGALVGGRSFVVTDEAVAEHHLGTLPDLNGAVEIPPGEEHKTLATAERVWRALAAQGVTRTDHVVALGGGVVGDLAGFCAACYQRGIPVVQCPTTVVAQVDSAYGGKTGVDLPEAKNYVGAYHQPAAVLVDPGTLTTLPAEELAAGYAEVVKTALIAGGALWERIASGAPVDDDVVLACARTKLAVVAADERDGGLRQVLNLGHTVGHALETVTGYGRLRHGEAVGLGLLAALRLSGQDALREEVAGLLGAAGLPTSFDEADPEEVVRATAKDKKRVGEGPTPFVLVRAPGDVVHGQEVQGADVLAAVRELAG
ncbi:bifunctional shikimate kinase/3-dehydroquinate synthase [Conexibacter sp. SYSU D00693]|uniref:bifunctional shikimate kinase/3-dehydroquinate synthase n=1 Tax=Conexibacter sp. SYSU D00693 TaxID=2812560 RepID=UPI001F11BC8D|nr:bifunctional shikimate kinase/3-dehydroquinate synthase [Conexibacter sp. SYSU D00693]